MVYKDGSLGQGFKLKGADISVSSPEHINSISSKLETLLVGLPEGVRLQIFFKLGSNIDALLKEHESVSREAPSEYGPIRENRLKYLSDKQADKCFFVPEIYLFLRSSPHSFRKRKFFERQTEFQGFSENEYKSLREKFLNLSAQIQSALLSARLKPTVLTSEEWIKVMFPYFNLKRSEKLGLPKMSEGAA
jgi:hypothetical protein